jgi:hypothetical protein
VAGLNLILDGPVPDEFVDAIWAIVSPEIFTMLTESRGWSLAAVETWLVEMADAALHQY